MREGVFLSRLAQSCTVQAEGLITAFKRDFGRESTASLGRGECSCELCFDVTWLAAVWQTKCRHDLPNMDLKGDAAMSDLHRAFD